QPGPVGRVCDPARCGARAQGLSRPVRDQPRDRAAEARHDGRGDRPAHGGAGEVPRFLGRGNLKALILAAGYATRLRPLTDTVPKQLLPVGGRPMLDWILDRILETSADEIHLVTNARFAPDFERWAEDKDVRVHDDGTT